MDTATLRRSVYAILLTLTLGITTARVMDVEFVYEPSIYHAYPTRTWPREVPENSPTFSSNDRSRWATIRALVEEGTFVIGRRVEVIEAARPFRNARPALGLALGGSVLAYRDEGIVFADGYGTVDRMLNPATWDFYSTKPPLLTVLAAGQYWALKKFLHWDLDHNRWEVVCTVLITFNVIPLAIYLLLLARLIEEYGASSWGRVFVFAAACLGTFLTTFPVTLNNHVPAAVCVLFAIYPILRGRSSDVAFLVRYPAIALFISGFFAGLATAFELPAAAFAAGLGLLILLRERSLVPIIWYGLAAAIPVALLLYTNYAALGELNIGYSKLNTPWYDYEGSHWLKRHDPKAEGIDFAHEPKHIYALHLLVGHHGLFSLTPVFLFSMVGMLCWRFQKPVDTGGGLRDCPDFRVMALLVSAVVIGFYIWKTNNYGGWTSGPRWLFFLTPLLLLSMMPVTDWLSRASWRRGLGYILLAASAFSAAYPVWNPWRHPWIYQLCEYYGWIKY